MVTLGITLGSAATPEMMHGMATYPISLTLLALGTVCVTLGSMLYLRYVHGWSPLSALLGAVPGALSQTVAIALETKSDEVGVAIVQTLRVALLTIFLPMGLALVGLSITGPGMGRLAVADTTLLPLLIGVSAAGGYLFHRLKFPGGWMFGAMLGSGALHAFGIVRGGLPIWIISIAMICIGSMVGTRFATIGLAAFTRYLAAGVGSLVVALSIIAVFLVLTVWLAGAPIHGHDHGLCAGCDGRDDGGGADAAARSDLRRRAPPVPLRRRVAGAAAARAHRHAEDEGNARGRDLERWIWLNRYRVFCVSAIFSKNRNRWPARRAD